MLEITFNILNQNSQICSKPNQTIDHKAKYSISETNIFCQVSEMVQQKKIHSQTLDWFISWSPKIAYSVENQHNFLVRS